MALLILNSEANRKKANLLLRTVIAFVIILQVVAPQMTMWGQIAFTIFFVQVADLLLEAGTSIPIRQIFGVMFSLQMLIGAALVYNGFDKYQFVSYYMRVTETEYFTYIIPAMFLFMIGLRVGGKREEQQINEGSIQELVERMPSLPMYLIIVGIAASFAATAVPGNLQFFLILVGSLKFVGLFLMIIGNRRLKVSYVIIIYTMVISSSLTSGMFHDLLIWLIFLGLVLAIKYKPKNTTKVIVLLTFAVFAVFIQAIKGGFRKQIGEDENVSRLDAIEETTSDLSNSEAGFFSMENLAPHIVRINQGWIISAIMVTVPKDVEHTRGSLLLVYLEAAFLPRFIAPDKLEAGDQQLFIKYSGHGLQAGTSMALSPAGDAYIEFGKFGGAIFMFCYGLLFNLVIKRINKLSVKYPALLLFCIVLFVYPIRPDCETQTTLGHLVKASFVVWLIHYIYRSKLIDTSLMIVKSRS